MLIINILIGLSAVVALIATGIIIYMHAFSKGYIHGINEELKKDHKPAELFDKEIF